MAITVKKIAELAGVSAGTVDRALNNRKGVNPDTAGRIREIADSLGYIPNKAGKALVMRRMALKIGIIIHTARHPFFEEVMRGIRDEQEEVSDYGVEVIVKHGKDFDPEDQLRIIEEMRQEGVRALAIVPIHDQRILDKLAEIQREGIPVVLLVSDESIECLAYVGCDVRQVGRVSCGLAGLITGGSARVLYLTPSLGILGNETRLRGFQEGIEGRYPGIRLLEVCEMPNDDLLSYRMTLELLKKHREVDAVVSTLAYNNGFLRAVEDQGLAGKVKIIALDMEGSIMDGMRKDQVAATIVQHPHRQGKRALQILFDYLVVGKRPQGRNDYLQCDIRIYENVF